MIPRSHPWATQSIASTSHPVREQNPHTHTAISGVTIVKEWLEFSIKNCRFSLYYCGMPQKEEFNSYFQISTVPFQPFLFHPFSNHSIFQLFNLSIILLLNWSIFHAFLFSTIPFFNRVIFQLFRREKGGHAAVHVTRGASRGRVRMEKRCVVPRVRVLRAGHAPKPLQERGPQSPQSLPENQYRECVQIVSAMQYQHFYNTPVRWSGVISGIPHHVIFLSFCVCIRSIARSSYDKLAFYTWDGSGGKKWSCLCERVVVVSREWPIW